MSLYPAMFSCKMLDVASDRKLRCHQTSKKKLCELLVFTFFEGFFFKHVKYEAKFDLRFFHNHLIVRLRKVIIP